jgi:DNA repair exonuclease SbcCD ATPase subunit
MTEVDALTAERNDLMLKMSADENENNSKRQRNGNDPPMTKRLREQIGKLQCRIDELKVKANEHERSTKMKEEAEKKCARLLAEIAEDKRRRADLQRKLKEASVEMRTEKKAAQQKASKLLKDSQRLKIELTKMKNVAQKQAAVLKRKIDQASAKEKARVELERKRRSAENMRLTSSSNSNPQVNETRKTELSSWVDHEFEYSLIKFEIDDQRRRLENAVADRSKLMASSGDVVCVEDLEEMDIAIRSLRITVQDLETIVKKAFPTAGDCNAIFRFLDTDKFKGDNAV